MFRFLDPDEKHKAKGIAQLLLLTRRTGETVNIGDDITVTVLSIRGNQVRLGFKAPAEVHILRAELVDRDREKNGNE